jgi:hypothetical protein
MTVTEVTSASSPHEQVQQPLEVGISGSVTKIELREKQQHFTIASEKEPVSLMLDPNTWTLMSMRFSKS